MTVDLAAFLLARYADDEDTARKVASVIAGSFEGRGPFAPERVLAECDAKRRIVELHVPGQPWCECGVWDTTEHGMPGYEICPTLRLLALPYADSPGYDERWRP